ncbi:leucine-rich repeat-containing protein 40-like isoform X2 [Rhopilema esculentum]|uniref:leucine-rich repeat-containing protein 40-like isoform X2 n=1 Tax=Rhopilema esculentum TaxID=499914 RepID=UPI0031DB12B8
MASRGKGKWKPQAGFGTGFGIESQGAGIPNALIKNARHSGQLNLSNRSLEEVPIQVWRINIDVPEEGKNVSLDTGSGDRWWEQVDLRKLILASNQIKELSSEIRNLPALNVLDVHDNKLESLPDELSELQELSRLNLSHNKFSVIPVSMTMLPSIQVLLLNGNVLTELPDDFGNLVNVEDLDLGDNRLTSLPESFGNLQRLRKLNLGNNELENLPQGFRNLSVLQYLNLGNNKLKALPGGLDKMTALDILDCRANFISEFPPLGGIVNLKELYLSNNRIKQLDADMFKYLPTLVTFDVKDNTIQSVPEEITLCCKLERLDLTNNCLSILPFTVGNMENLKTLSLDGNPLRGIRRDVVAKGTQAVLAFLKSRIPLPDQEKSNDGAANKVQNEINDNTISLGGPIDLHKATSTRKIEYSKKATSIPESCFVADVPISVVDFSKNLLSDVPIRLSTYADTLVDLSLSSNKITTIPSELAALQKLTFLDLGNNMISEIPEECKSWQCLSQITISSNRFKEVPKLLYEIGTLETILASSNQIIEIDVDGLKKLQRISTLDLSNNNISHVPPELGNVTTLKSLQIEGNSFRNPRHNILTKGTAQVLEYLRDRIPR